MYEIFGCQGHKGENGWRSESLGLGLGELGLGLGFRGQLEMYLDQFIS